MSEYERVWEAVELADHANLGLVIDSFHMLANGASFDTIDHIPWNKIAMVQLSDFMWREIRSSEERLETARHMRVFSSEGEHSHELADLVRRCRPPAPHAGGAPPSAARKRCTNAPAIAGIPSSPGLLYCARCCVHFLLARHSADSTS